MHVWDELTLEQFAVMVTAVEEAYLNNVIDEYGARLEWAKTRDTTIPSKLDAAAKRQLIPHFASVVLNLIERGWIELTEEPTLDRRHDAEPISGASLHDTLHDPASWMETPDGRRRMVTLTQTEAWELLTRQASNAVEAED
ncbi:hypothetical protein [Polymorphospora rubra]|uniref:Uncharacterized protein n=1 Tax=Polymorphospora rubra TaxID=338584 RepID=A0A810MP49_9ACTN|nr:hypothetical protein [Polymorphospora rubra]BCJ63027.1 hypothetical protein Prubr_00480 [Polymorphospora rubra]